MTIPTLDDVRRLIAEGAPQDDREMQQLVEWATCRLADPSLERRLRSRLRDELFDLVLAREVGVPVQIALAMDDVQARLNDIEQLSRLA